MKFALLIYQEEEKWSGATEQERRAAYDAHGAFIRRLAERDVGRDGGEELALSGSAKTMRRRDGDWLVTDGPYAETTEQLGGFYIIDAADVDEALELAAYLPGTTVEVRPVAEPPAC
ncbi:YciI family protein [Actinomadura sp. 3N407]|uniref:YciI family protein n=1 Tax=Actinomadura sp. 3N407 TaxID=3457423 RepID=UPI003FCD1922